MTMTPQSRMLLLCLSLLLCLVAVPCFAASCDDVQSAAREAIRARNEQAKATYDATMGDPEDDRSAVGSCLDSIFSIGDAFSLGVKIPSLDQIIERMCNQVNSAIQDKVNQAMNNVENSVSDFGNGVLQVNGSGSALAKPLLGQIK